MKKLMSMCLISGLILCSGCGNQQSADLAPVPETTTASSAQVKDAPYEITVSDFESFFKEYFSLDEDDMLMLNQNPAKVDGTYWSDHDKYKEKINSVLGKFLSKGVSKRLDTEYLYDKLHLPRKLIINDYATFGKATVERVEIISTRLLDNNMVYEIGVTTKNKVQPTASFIKQYKWNSQKNYYERLTSNSNNQGGTVISNTMESQSKIGLSYYLQNNNAGDEDEIKLVQHYWVEVQQDETLEAKMLKIGSIKEAAPVQREGDNRTKANNTSFVTRIPYYKEATSSEQNILKKVFTEMMSRPKGFYQYYEKAIGTSFEVFREIWENSMKLSSEVYVSADTYKDSFKPFISPYKDNVEGINFDAEKMTIMPSIYSTYKQPRFVATLPVKVLTNNNQTVFYNYKYLVGMENGKVEFIEFMNMEASTEAASSGSTDATTDAAIATTGAAAATTDAAAQAQ